MSDGSLNTNLMYWREKIMDALDERDDEGYKKGLKYFVGIKKELRRRQAREKELLHGSREIWEWEGGR